MLKEKTTEVNERVSSCAHEVDVYNYLLDDAAIDISVASLMYGRLHLNTGKSCQSLIKEMK